MGWECLRGGGGKRGFSDRAGRVVRCPERGESVSYGPGGMQQIARVDVESDLAWRRGKLIFEDRPLQQVVADVNRYRSGTIRILDAKLMDLRVSGIFNIAEPDAVLTTITETLPVRAVRLTDYLVLLRGT